MDRNFFIPIAVAAGAHSFLFFSGTPAIPTPPLVEPVVLVFDPPVLPPLEPEVHDSDEPAEKPSDVPPPPQSLNLPSPTFSTEDITLPFDPFDMLPRPDGPVADTISSDWRKTIAGNSNHKGGLIDWLNLENSPAARFQPAPTYPRDLKSTGIDGSVTVTFSVDVNGSVFNASVTRASHELFGEEALRAVRKWRFEPGIKDGKRVAFRMVQTFSFTLSE